MHTGDDPNVIILVIDTLRKDYARFLEDNLKKLGFIAYENAIAPAPWTLPSHASLLTGLYPAFHGAHETKDKKGIQIKLRDTQTIVTYNLNEIGYRSYLFSANPYVHPTSGFKGFNEFYDIGINPIITILSSRDREVILKGGYIKNSKIKTILSFMDDKKYILLLKLALEHINNQTFKGYPTYLYNKIKGWPKNKGSKNLISMFKKSYSITSNPDPKFIFINLMEVHDPYFFGLCGSVPYLLNFKQELRNKISDRCLQKLRKAYLDEVRFVTAQLLVFFNILKKRGLFDNSLIIVTSDHGQLLGEHGKFNHGTFLYDELLRVPLLIKYPKNTELSTNNSHPGGYISLTTLPKIILKTIKGQLTDDKSLYSRIAFSESYGSDKNIDSMLNEKEIEEYNKYDKYRIAIYYKNFKGIFNVTDWKFEEIISYDPNVEVTEDVVKHMKKEVMKFLKTATVAKVPKIKI
ncbi:sulfatase-like hydrolase/transferase [Thermococcus sp. MV11]|uniref:sulfatase-like hydrolase/transferase n=1 Tax=Thermococcus sp. MV11 TaxID=1638267 RepID=UPI00142FC2C8|nr:sulfatase-like hydrolase/transferase [Thermococcus sp. MV11]NJE03844.1 DUF229 domain-containing protein [Thermococcus sp. MV11]